MLVTYVQLMNLLIGVTGSVAAIKLNELIQCIKERRPDVHIKVILTPRALQFVNQLDIQAEAVFSDEHEWTAWKKKGDPVLHIELRKWAHVLLIAPLSANTLAKIANGICDNLLTSVVRAWDTDKKLILCPAMNTFMWGNPLTRRQLDSAREVYGTEVIEPKTDSVLACGDQGAGAMADVRTICERILKLS